jgi:3-oxoacyl-[acyl-carrier protein] reductase
MRLLGKVALVTGSATGIGRGIALALAHEGAAIVVNYTKSLPEAEATQHEVEALGAKALLVKADVSRDEEVRRMVETTMDNFHRIDILVNNAGITHRIPFTDLESATDEVWDSIFGVNVKGTFFCARAVAPIMKKLGEGCIINLASVAGITGQGSSIPYAASKAAVISLTKSLSRTLGPEIRVNAIAPGFVPTRWNAGLEGRHAGIISETPLGRLPLPEDMGGVAVALATEARFVTGQVIVVDGGKI